MDKQPRKTISVMLPMDVYEKLKAVANEADWTVSRYVRQMIRRYLRHLEELKDWEDDWWRIR